ncbi:hypothetical protein CJS27_24275 [Salmonella enterica]|nr:hypothetical protein [Salmonella enterica]
MKNTQYKRYGTIQKYSTIHSIHTIQIIHTVRTVHTPSFFLRSDPKKASPGSAFCSRGRHHLKTQYVPLRQQHSLLYVVLCTFSVTRRAGAEKTASFIS